MSIVVPQTGLDIALNNIGILWGTGAVTMHLYQNNLSPIYSTIPIDFIEATFAGYNPIILPGFTLPPVAVGDGIHEQIPQTSSVTFTSGTLPSNTIYGYYCLDGSGNLLWAELLPGGPFIMGSAGQSLQIQVLLTARSEF